MAIKESTRNESPINWRVPTALTGAVDREQLTMLYKAVRDAAFSAEMVACFFQCFALYDAHLSIESMFLARHIG